MLSAKSETFIENLRLYLVTSGKKEKEIIDLTGELKVHLIEAEKDGKNIDEIIDCTPEQYMNSLKREMDTDFKSLAKYLPIFFAGVTAYFIMGPAIRGELTLNIVQVIGFPLTAIAGLLIYVFFLQQAGKKQFSTKRLFLIGMIASACVTILFLLLLLGSGLFVQPFYTGSATVNWIIVGICSAIFILLAVWSKTWLTIWLPGILFIPDVLFRFSNFSDTTILIIGIVTFVCTFVIIILSLFLKTKN
ncbi:HAAS domain-containing protein [Siminovitchia terrae]|uniref:HAAS domain-containing protein n=1 Tax=Siminovitchia terrae TaxID=1914933 RepID=UPI0028B180FC|nr:hypothetical protein [Siminovitchia terrae]